MYYSRKNIKISFARPKFETVGTTVRCILNYVINAPYVCSTNKEGAFVNVEHSIDFGPQVAVGTATLSPEDTFNKKTGREIAEARAESAAYKHASKLLKNAVDSYVNELELMVERFHKKTEKVVSHNITYVKTQGNPPTPAAEAVA